MEVVGQLHILTYFAPDTNWTGGKDSRAGLDASNKTISCFCL